MLLAPVSRPGTSMSLPFVSALIGSASVMSMGPFHTLQTVTIKATWQKLELLEDGSKDSLEGKLLSDSELLVIYLLLPLEVLREISEIELGKQNKEPKLTSWLSFIAFFAHLLPLSTTFHTGSLLQEVPLDFSVPFLCCISFAQAQLFSQWCICLACIS